MDDLTPRQRKYLRAEAHHLRPNVQIGKLGLSESVIEETSRSLDSHELVKVKFVDCKTERRDLSQKLAESCQADLVALIGNISILYREHLNEEKRNYKLPH